MAQQDGADDGAEFQRWWRWWWSRVFGDDDDDDGSGGGDDPSGGSDGDDQISQIDDFYEQFRCCDTIHSYYSVHCHDVRVNSSAVLLIVFVLLLCGLVKSILRAFSVGWMPEAGGCILVGSAVGSALALKFPDRDFVREFSFDDEFFMCILLPPIVFQAALSIDKKALRSNFVPIAVFAAAGTVVSAVLTGWIVHALSTACSFLVTIPMLDALVFGSLISSVDPVATLSVLGSVGVSETDALYVLVFGESLLNDGAAIVLFRSLVRHLDGSAPTDVGDGGGGDDIAREIAQNFLLVSLGSAAIGLGCGILCAVYFSLLRGKQPPVLEVSTFFCWALVPYYVADACGGSGIVAILTLGFFADAYVVGDRRKILLRVGGSGDDNSEAEDIALEAVSFVQPAAASEDCSVGSNCGRVHRILSGDGHLSHTARSHVDFVAEVLASVMETAVFAYMGLFLFAERQFRNAPLNIVAIFACVVSRLVSVVSLSWLINVVGKVTSRWWPSSLSWHAEDEHISSNSGRQVHGPVIDRKMQLILLLSGMRGAVSVALAENVPLYNAVTKSGSKVKLEIKAMTSSSIIFTVFNFGALTYFALRNGDGLGPAWTAPRNDDTEEEVLQTPLLESTSTDDDQITTMAPSTLGDVS